MCSYMGPYVDPYMIMYGPIYGRIWSCVGPYMTIHIFIKSCMVPYMIICEPLFWSAGRQAGRQAHWGEESWSYERSAWCAWRQHGTTSPWRHTRAAQLMALHGPAPRRACTPVNTSACVPQLRISSNQKSVGPGTFQYLRVEFLSFGVFQLFWMLRTSYSLEQIPCFSTENAHLL